MSSVCQRREISSDELGGCFGFTEASPKGEKEEYTHDDSDIATLKPSQPHLLLRNKEKKREMDFLLFHLIYGRFLVNTTINTPTRIIATKRPATAGRKYRSAAEGAGVGIGVAVAAGAAAEKPTAACVP
jgi:hypothetical protein